MQNLKTTGIVFICLFIASICPAQNVGIGTTVPSNNAILDVASTSKGIMLPRLDDTTVVASPSAGLLIYNKKTGSPNYYDGVRWQNFTTTATTFPQDSITYNTTSTSGGVVIGTFNLIQINHTGTSSGGQPTINTMTISKNFDANTIPFKKMLASQVFNPFIEFKVYTPGSSTPYFSIKLTNWQIREEDLTVSSLDGKMLENYMFISYIIGFKDWINNQSFGWDKNLLQIVSY